MITKEQYKQYYDFIIDNISKMKQTYKHFNELISIESMHYLIDLLNTWEFDNKWIENNMSEKIKDASDKEIIRKEFYDNLISNITFEEAKLDSYNICGFYSINKTTNYIIDENITIEKNEGRKIVIDNNKSNQKIILYFFLIYHMLIVEGLIEDKGISISLDELKKDFNDNLDIINLCKICIKDTLIKEDKINSSETQDIPIWFIENYLNYKKTNDISHLY